MSQLLSDYFFRYLDYCRDFIRLITHIKKKHTSDFVHLAKHPGLLIYKGIGSHKIKYLSIKTLYCYLSHSHIHFLDWQPVNELPICTIKCEIYGIDNLPLLK